MNGAKVQYNFDLALISVYIKRRFIFFYLFRFRVLYRQTGSPGPVRFSFTDRRNSLRSDTTGRAFGKPNRILVPAPMVFRHKTLHLTAELTGKEKYKQKFAAAGSRTVRMISSENNLS